MSPSQARQIAREPAPAEGRKRADPRQGKGKGKGKKRSCGPGPGIRPSKSGPRRAAVLVLVHVAIAAHVAHYLVSGSTVSPLEPSEAMAFTKDGIVNAGLVFFGATILLTAVFGRWFCGWGCHLVALQDLCRWLLGKIGIRPRPLRSRLLLAVPVLAFGYMFLYPLGYRLWHGLGFGHHGTELTTVDFWGTFPPWPIALATFLFSGFLIVYFLGAKGFCTYACPYGAIFGIVDRIAPGRIRVTDACEGCGHCTAVCSSNVEVHAEVRDYGAVIDPGCMKCLDCVSVCPNDALYFGWGAPEVLIRKRKPRAARIPSERRSRSKLRRWKQLGWWEELVLAGSFLAAFLAFRGLYGMVPFLFSLAIAGVLSYLSLQTARLLARRNVSIQWMTAKADGRLTGAGRIFVATMAVVGLVWLHSAWIQVESHGLERGWRATEELRQAWFQDPERALSGADHTTVEALLARADRLERWALVEDPRLPARAASLTLLLGEPADFERRMEAAIERDPTDAALHSGLAEYFAALGRVEPAMERFAHAIGLDPRDADLQRRMLLAAQNLRALARATEALAEVLARNPEEPVVLLHAGLLELELGKPGAALPYLRRAVDADPGALTARENLAMALKVLGRHREAIAELEELLARRPGVQDSLFQVADSAARLGEYPLAEQYLRKLESPASTAAQAWALVGSIARERGDAEAAARFFSRAVELDPSIARRE